MDRSRRYRYEPSRNRDEYEEDEVDDPTPSRARGGGIYATANTGTRPQPPPIATSAVYTGAQPISYSSSHSSIPSATRIPTLDDYVPVYPVGNVHGTGSNYPRASGASGYRQSSIDDSSNTGNSARYPPPMGPPPGVDDGRLRRTRQAEAAPVDHHELLEQISSLSIRPDPPAATSKYPSDVSYVPADAPPASRRRPERFEQPRFAPPPGPPPPGPPTGYGGQAGSGGGLMRYEPDDLSGKVVLHGETYFAVGGFSSVWLGRWADPNYGPPGQLLALKAFSGSRLPLQSEKFKARVRRETLNWHKMRHANVLPLLGICKSPVDGIPDYPLLVSYYCREGNVNDYLRRHPRTPRGTIIAQISDGLMYLHEHGFVHGDLKGSNILIKDDGQACICDFGRTTLAGDEDYSKTLIGSAYWLAPELINHDDNQPLPITYESDMWALGMVVIEVYTGDRPWPNVRDYIVLQLVSSGSTPRREDYRTIPSRVWNEITLCWARDPNERPAIRNFKANILAAMAAY